MSSFYGGKQGRTYHLVQHYDTIKIKEVDYPAFDASKKHLINSKVKYNNKYYIFLEEVQVNQEWDLSKVREVKAMVNCFSQGGSYTEVNYGQYVIIDTLSKEDPENGCIYRRGFNYNEQPTSSTIQNPGAGAIYIGKISGPTGKTPDIAATATVDTAATTISISHEAPNTDGAGNITTANLKFTFPAYSLSTAIVTTVASGERPVVKVDPNSANPFAPIATIKVPIGRNGNSISTIQLDEDNGIFTANITTYNNSNTSGATTTTVGRINYPNNIFISTATGEKGNVIQKFINGSSSTIGHFKSIDSINSKDDSIVITYTDGDERTVIPIGSQFHVYGNFASSTDLPQGGFSNSHKGWIATVGTGATKEFYAYDHQNNTGWYKIGEIGEDIIEPERIMIISDTEPSSTSLKENGYWFVLSD